MSVDFVPGNSEYVSCGSGASIDDIWDGGGSLALWMKSDADPADNASFRVLGQSPADASTGWALLFSNEVGATNYDRALRLRQARATAPGDWFLDESDTPANGTWFHLAITYDDDSTGNDPIFYIDGAAKGIGKEESTPNGAVASGAGEDFELGRAGAEYYDGQQEDVRLANVIWTPEQVAQLAAGYRGPLGGEALWLSMNEATGAASAWEGTSLANGTNLLPDLSVNSNNGDPVNTPTGRASTAPRYGVAV
jgi:hypothetical protein